MRVFCFNQSGSRSHQEDAYYIDENNKSIFMICDGVGGNSGGALASNSTVEYFIESIGGVLQNESSDGNILSLYAGAKDNLLEILKDYPSYKGMATTIVIAWFTFRDVIISHIGDSRAYVFRTYAKSYWRTKDHSLVQELYDAGIIKSEADMQTHPMKNRVTGAITSSTRSEVTDPSITRFDELDPRDIIMLCSDGVLEAFPNEEFIRILMDETTTFEEKGKTIQMECEQKSIDNNTCIILQLEDGESYSSGSNAGIEFRKPE